MKGVNKAIIIGHLGKDPETRFTPSGTAIASFSVATTESWKEKETGEKKERTEWHRIEAFGKLAEICGEYLKKGSHVYIEGKLRTDEYEKDGIKRWSTKIIADQMQMLGGKGDNSGAGSSREPRQSKPAPEPSSVTRQELDEDEIPFR